MSPAVAFEAVDGEALAGARQAVTAQVRASGCVPEGRVDAEVGWFFEELGIDPAYLVR